MTMSFPFIKLLKESSNFADISSTSARLSGDKCRRGAPYMDEKEFRNFVRLVIALP